MRFWTFLKQISDLLKKLWTFQYAAGFRGPGILFKRSTFVDLSVYAAWLRGPDISQNIQKIFLKYPKIDYRAFASSRRHYAADNCTACGIQNFGPFWVVKIQGGGGMPPGPPDKNIPDISVQKHSGPNTSGRDQGRRLRKMPRGHSKSTRANPCYRGAVGCEGYS